MTGIGWVPEQAVSAAQAAWDQLDPDEHFDMRHLLTAAAPHIRAAVLHEAAQHGYLDAVSRKHGAEAAVARVRALHRVWDGDDMCGECGAPAFEGPCPTIRALDGGDA